VKEGIIRYNTPEELLANPDIQVVIIAVNNNQHKKLVMQAAQAGKDIICEKPVAMSVADLDEMTELVNRCGVKFTVHQQRRLDPDFRTVKAIYDARTLGRPYVIKSSLYGFNGNMHDWHVFISEGGGMLFDWGVHLIDQILWMVKGKVTSVYADVRNVINFEVDDYFNIILKFDNNVTAQIELGTYFLSDKEHWFERHWFMGGDKGSAYIDGFNPQGKIIRTAHLLENVGGKRTMTAAGPTRSFGPAPEGMLLKEDLPKVETSHRDYFENYLKAWNGEEEFLVKIDETRRVLSLMEAVRESARTGKSRAFE
jgi:predicted dehydrogenase